MFSCHGFWLFPDRLIGGGDRWRSKHHTESGTQVLGAWSLSLDGDLDTPPTGVERVGLVCIWGADEACVSGYPAGLHWFMNRRESGTTWLWSSTVVRTEI